jgi:hypothetical protein
MTSKCERCKILANHVSFEIFQADDGKHLRQQPSGNLSVSLRVSVFLFQRATALVPTWVACRRTQLTAAKDAFHLMQGK